MCAHWDPGEGAVTPQETEPDLPASVGGSPSEVGVAVPHCEERTLAAEVLGSTPWHEPSQSPPLTPPKSLGSLQCWVA